ncbi:hypothetical protein ACN28S_46005 [Cystobacter fuscus]
MEIKSILFLLVSAVVLYVGCGWVGRASWRKDACVFLLVLGTVHSGLVDINLMSREWYRGTTRGSSGPGSTTCGSSSSSTS